MKTTSFRFFLAALATTVTLVGCTKEITPNFENDKVNPEGSRIIAVSFAPQTKTTLDGFQPRFEDGKDTVLISNTNALDTCVVSVKDNKATISTNLIGPLTAVYPYKAAKMSEGNENEIDTVLVSTVQSGKFADANICMARMTDENEESLSFENKTTVFCIKPPTNSPEYVEVSAEGFDIANHIPTGSTNTDSSAIRVPSVTTDSVYVSILVPDGLKVSHLKFSDGTKEKTITTGAKATEEIAAGTLYTVTATDWASPEADIPEPLSGKFSVSADKQVQFSQGNLRYVVGTQEWGFYEHQYDFCNTSEYNGRHSDTVSLFTWGYNAEKSIVPNGNASDNVSTTSGNLKQTEDWGSQIGDGNTWRTLTKDEWAYLFESRSKASTLYKCGVTVCGKINCVVLLPDEWNETIIPLTNFATQTTYNESSTPKWSEMEAAGAVCLPAAGRRYGSNVSYVGSSGCYWSSTAVYTSTYYVNFNSGNVGTDNHDGRGNGCSVRLVTDVTAAPTPTPTAPEGFVDLGVKDADGNPVYWAERNLGASKPEEYGTYFSWGETGEGRVAATLEINAFTTKPFGWDQDVFGQTFNNGISLSDACLNGILAQTYDAAYQTDNVWRMPTSEDFTDLAKQCFLEWTNNYKGTTNVKGVIVWKAKDGDAGWFKPSASGKGCKIEDDGSEYKDPETHTFSNAYAIGTDSHVFFPAAGIGHGSDLVGASDGGYYWSSSLYTDNTDNAYSLIFESGNVYPRGYFARYYGFSVRPVSD